jgi:glutathione reductase (NADPH)
MFEGGFDAMSEYDYDVLYLGSGHGAFDGAGPLAATGQKVGVIESDMIGGTCPNYGCNAKITLDAPVVLQRMAERMQGVVSGQIGINWKALVAHKQAVINPLPDAIGGKLTQSGATIIRGHGQFTDAHTIAVDSKSYTAEKIVIATGQRPHRLDIPGTELAHDSRDFMALTELPEQIGILGSGYISMEFATMANAAGAAVTVFMRGDTALREFHQPFVKQVMADMTKRGVAFVPNAHISALTREKDGIAIHYGAQQEETVDWVLDATGRIPNADKIGLEAAGVEYTKHGIVVDDHLRTNIPNIYASGDVLAKDQPKLTPTATFESYYLFHLLSGQTTDPINYPAIPTTVYTSPRIAKVGVTPEAAANGNYKLVHNHIPDDWYRQIDEETMGDNILIFDQGHHLVGATEFSEQAEDSINTLLPAVVFHYDQAQMWQLAHIFPSISASAWHKIR